MTNSKTGGYLLPTSTDELPKKLSLTQFIQTVLVGISGIPDTLVRPKWQPNPPVQPSNETNWLAFGLQQVTQYPNGYIALDSDGNPFAIRQETLVLGLSFYGPRAYENSDVVRDGFQIQQNLDGLRAANMGFTDVGPAIQAPDLVNERWIDRFEMTVTLQRQVQRTYALFSFLSVKGTIHAELKDEADYTLDYDSTKHRS